MGQLDKPDPQQLRISDDDRHKVADILRDAAGEGRIDFDELDERLEATYAAKTYADLMPITFDLPSGSLAVPRTPCPPTTAGDRPSPVVAGPDSSNHVAILGGFDRSGHWIVPRQMSVFAMLGGAELDMREAQFADRDVVITVNVFMGGVDITVNPHTNVVIEGTGIMGGYSGPSGKVPAELDANSVTVRVRGVAIWGGVAVSRKLPPGESPKSLNRA
jgi:hypothetical protein